MDSVVGDGGPSISSTEYSKLAHGDTVCSQATPGVEKFGNILPLQEGQGTTRGRVLCQLHGKSGAPSVDDNVGYVQIELGRHQ